MSYSDADFARLASCIPSAHVENENTWASESSIRNSNNFPVLRIIMSRFSKTDEVLSAAQVDESKSKSKYGPSAVLRGKCVSYPA
eukprot:3437412-Pleurochrysis_carterae.AAC.1